MGYFEMNLNMAIAFRVNLSYNFDPLYDYFNQEFIYYISEKIYNKISIKHRINMWERSFLLLCQT
jgi:hypothetical protein